MMGIACILLGAGAGKRFGGNKLQHEVDGVSMAERALALHADLPYAAKILVTRPGDGFVRELGERYGFTVIVNERAEQGIGTSAAAGILALAALPGDFAGALFGVCDQPYLTQTTVRTLLSVFARQPECIVAPVCAGRRGNPVIFPKDTFAELSKLEQDEGGSVVVRRHPELLHLTPIESEQDLTDIDTRG